MFAAGVASPEVSSFATSGASAAVIDSPSGSVRSAGGKVRAWSMARRSASRPSPRVATVGTTAMPSAAMSAGTSMVMPAASAASNWLSAITVGRPSPMTCEARKRLRSRWSASAMITTTSGRGTSFSWPRSTASAISSSGESAVRL